MKYAIDELENSKRKVWGKIQAQREWKDKMGITKEHIKNTRQEHRQVCEAIKVLKIYAKGKKARELQKQPQYALTGKTRMKQND